MDEHDAPLTTGETGRLRYRGPGVAGRFIDADGTEQAINPEGLVLPRATWPQNWTAGISSCAAATRTSSTAAASTCIRWKSSPSSVQLPAVREAAVVGEPSEKFGETVTAFIAANEAISEAALQEHCEHNWPLQDSLPLRGSRRVTENPLRQTGQGSAVQTACKEIEQTGDKPCSCGPDSSTRHFIASLCASNPPPARICSISSPSFASSRATRIVR